MNQITKISITCDRGNSYRARLPQRVVDSCHVLQSLLFMILGHMGETHTDGIPVKFIILFDFNTECYNFILKGLIDQLIQRKCNNTALIFFKGYECWGGASS